MKKNFLKSLLCAVFCGFYAINATAATSLFSDYGQIQNVQHYSTNPFWTPNSPYNQRMPQPVYVQGADLTAEDCFKVVQSLVSVQCMARDNCKNTTLSDIRPTIMVQLSNLPGNNYVSACSGYIDGVFESYVAQYGNALPNRAVAFPAGTTPNQNLNGNSGVIQIENPYKQIPAKWQMEIKERSNELQQLQKQNGAGSEHLSATAFPTTFEDLSFSERMAVKAEGYEPYKDASAYVIPNFVNKTEWCNGAGSGSPECSDIQTLTKTEDALKSDETAPNKNNALTQYGIDYVLPWFGILVVKKGSLDSVYKSDKPFIAPSYMKEHKNTYYPANSDKVLGITKGCTHGNHTANDKDVINRATHVTMDEKDSFFSGNDYYVYDGEDVYWGTAVVVGEIALALLTLGASAEAQALTDAKLANDIRKVGKSTKAATVAIKDTEKVQKAAAAAQNLTKTSTAAEKAKVITDLRAAGVTIPQSTGYKQLQQIGSILSNSKNVSWTSALIHGNKWRMLKEGSKNIVPTTKKIFGTGASLGRSLATTALVVGGTTVANSLSDTAHKFFISLLKANGYSTASTSITDDPKYKNLKFNSFGLLSADDIEDHENDVSHGTWLQFDTVGEYNSGDKNNPGDAENEAARFAQEFAKDVKKVNANDPLCDIDIFVVRPVIGDPFNKGQSDIYYLLYTDPTADNNSLRIESNK